MVFEARFPPMEGFVEQEIDGERILVETEAHVRQRILSEQNSRLLIEAESLKEIIGDVGSMALKPNVILADGNQDANRVLASDFAVASEYLGAASWSEGMTTRPGDLVMDPDQNYTYIYTGKVTMTHSNPLFYPGATGVYYWAIIPKVKDGFKIYPDISGIIVAVKKGETWWNTTADKKYKWVGEDNANCVWAPGTAPTMWTEIIE